VTDSDGAANLEIETAIAGSAGNWTAQIGESALVGSGGGKGQWGLNGGYLAVLALRAAGRHTGPMNPASLHCHFLGVAGPGEVTLTTRTLRETKRARSVQVTMEQQGQAVLTALVWNVTDDLTGLPDRSLALPDEPPPDRLPAANEVLGDRARRGGVWDLFDERPVLPEAHRDWTHRPWTDPLLRTWLRFQPTPRFSDPFADAGRAVIAIDCYPFMAATGVLRPDQVTHIAPTVALSVTFHRRQAAGSEWLLLHSDSPAAAGGLVGGRGTVWGEQGELIATGDAQMLCRPMG
jgi:acyl-CoA thioesterase